MTIVEKIKKSHSKQKLKQSKAKTTIIYTNYTIIKRSSIFITLSGSYCKIFETQKNTFLSEKYVSFTTKKWINAHAFYIRSMYDTDPRNWTLDFVLMQYIFFAMSLYVGMYTKSYLPTFFYITLNAKKKLYHCHFWIAREINLNDLACADRNACGYFLFRFIIFFNHTQHKNLCKLNFVFIF